MTRSAGPLHSHVHSRPPTTRVWTAERKYRSADSAVRAVRERKCTVASQLRKDKSSFQIYQTDAIFATFYRATARNATHGIAVAIFSVCLSDACSVTKLNDELRIV